MATTSAQILHHTTAFVKEILAQSDLRHRLYSACCSKIATSEQATIKPLNLAAETLEKAISTVDPTNRTSSLRLAEKLLLSYPEIAFSALLLSLIYGLCHRTIDAALCLLDLFYLDPSSARSEIASILFEELFLLHLLPVLQQFKDQRSRILSSLVSEFSCDSSHERSRSSEAMAVPYTKLLSRMNGDQASELKELERDYEEVLDENCRVYAEYLKKILEGRDGIRAVSPPPVISRIIYQKEKLGLHGKENVKVEEIELRNGRYNVMSKSR